MRPLAPVLCLLLAVGCGKPAVDSKATSQFAEVSLSFANPQDPATAFLNCTVGLIPAYKYKDAAELQVWVFPYASAARLTKDGDLSEPSLQGQRAPVLAQSFTAEGALLSFQARCPGAGRGTVVALDVLHNGRRLDRVFGMVQ